MKLSQWLNKKSRAEENKMIRIVRNSDLFDERWYVSQYQDVFKKLKDPARHYYQKGWKENRDPSDNFSTMAYLRRYPECEICPLVFEHNRNARVDLSVCAIVKNEAPYIEEWLNYHMLVGVKRFYIYDNESTDNLKEVLAPYIAQGLVIYKYYPGEAKQMSAYNECIKEYKDMTEWLAFIDVDEFIIPTEKDNIPEFLKEFKNCPGVGINWISFDGNGYKKQPDGGVLENYTRVHYDDQFSSNHHIKSIVRPTMVEKYTNPHYAIYVDGENAVDENGAELKGCTYCDVHPKAYTDVVSVNKIRINHYYCKSEEEYKAKLARGRALTKGGKKQFSDKALVFDDIKYDYTAYKYAEILYPEAAQRLKTKELYYKIKNLLIELKHTGKPCRMFDYIDEKWYFEQYPDAKESGMTALQHYLSIGWKEGKNPSKYFDTNFYLNKYKDISRAEINPLLHYITVGKNAGRLPMAKQVMKTDEKQPITEKEDEISSNDLSSVAPECAIKDNSVWTCIRKWFKKEEKEPKLTVNTKYVANPILFTPMKSYFSDRELKAEKYENAIFLPIKNRRDGLYKGGILDQKYEYVKESGISPNELIYGDYEYDKDNIPYIDEDVVYVGCFWNHFGHFILELISRLWYVIEVGKKDIKLAYSNHLNQKLPQYALDFLQLLGINEEQLILVKTPTMFRSIIVPDVSMKQMQYFTNKYKMIYDVIGNVINPIENDKIYLSRAHFKKAQENEFGEWYIEELFAANGYKIIYPEELSFIEQISLIRGAKQIACMMGTLSHLMLFAKDGANITIINKQSYILKNQLQINEVKRLNVTFVDSYIELPFVSPGKGPFLFVKNNMLQKFANDNHFKPVEYNREKAEQDFNNYIVRWQDLQNQGKLLKQISQSEKEKEINVFKQRYVTKNGFDFNLTVNKKTEKTITPYFAIKDEKWYEAHKGDYELCKNSEYFNKKYYILHNPKLIFTHQDHIEHYLTIGWKEGKNPSALFDTNAYLNKYQDIKRVGVNPLIHYLRNGKKEGRSAIGVKSWWNDMFNPYAGKSQSYQLIAHSNLFNKKWYLSTYQDVKKAGKDPIDHYLSDGWKLGYNPSKEFDTNAYLERHKDVARAKLNPLAHYLSAGIKERRTIFKIKECAFIEQKPNKFDIFMCKRKDKNPLISIIVASYNYADIIGRTLDSLVAQTYKNFEVIVVDDGSKDDSIKVIKKYTTKYPFIKLHRHKRGKNMGLPATVKLGLEKAKGEYIAFCESDDYWDKTHLEEKVKVINNYANPKIIVNDVELFGDEKKCKFVSTIVDERKFVLNKTKNKISVENFRDKNWIVTLSCCMIKKSVIDECDITGTPRGANLDWWIYRQACCGNTIFYVNKKLTYWNMHDSYMYLEMKDVVTAMLKQKMFIENMDKMLLSSHPIMAMKLWKYIPKIDKRYAVKEGKLYCGSKLCTKQPAFSVIMPTYNREKLLESSINSLLKQTYQNFELIIVDDGSTDDTHDFLNNMYSKELKSGKIKYIYKENGGVCKARNVGLRSVSNEWIAYLDSDNYLDSCSLETFAIAIIKNPHKKIFYANLIGINGKKIVGNKFDYESLLRENYIDLGVFVNHKSVYDKLGGFDENMTRLVDWDLIVRYTREYTPYYINKTILYYNDSQDYERITTSTKLYDNIAYFRKKNCQVPTVTTMITSYNHQDYIREAIESAIKQMGNFVHEIIISDDGSTDDTPKIIAEYAENYPHLIRNISDGKNIGISANMKKCFEAASGKYIAVLEGDDYWIDAYKLEKQMNFLEANKDCSMVFSKLRIFNESKGTYSYLARQNNLKDKLTGRDIIKEPTLNLMGNFSCCMFCRKYLLGLPKGMFATRLNEIAISFYIVQKGKIGFISTPLSVYRMRYDSVWTGADKINKLKQGLECRNMALAVCADKYKPALQKIIDEQYIKPLKEMEEQQVKQVV